MKTVTRYGAVSSLILGLCASSLAFEEAGFCDVEKYVLASHSSPSKSPPKPVVNNAGESVCVVEITNQDGSKTRQSGILFHPQLVVTAMHGFLESDAGPITNPSSAKVLFDYRSGNLPTTGWISVSDMDPTPTNEFYEHLNDIQDFIVLKLSQAQPSSRVSPYDVGTATNAKPLRPFFVHHACSKPMIVSYDYVDNNAVNLHRSSYVMASERFGGWKGSSGGGLFWSDDFASDPNNGKLMGLVCRLWPLTASCDGTRGYFTRGPRLNCVFDSNIGAKRILPAMGLGLSSNVEPEDLYQIWAIYPGVPASSASGPYKYELHHTSNGVVWFGYGDDAGSKVASIQLMPLFTGEPRTGNYRVRMKMMRSITCTEKDGMGEFLGDCPNLWNGYGETNVYMDFNGMDVISRSAIALNGGSAIANIDFYNKTVYESNVWVNDEVKYSNIHEFDLGTVSIDNTDPRFLSEIYIKVQSNLRYTDALDKDIVQGLSVHSISLEFEDATIRQPQEEEPTCPPIDRSLWPVWYPDGVIGHGVAHPIVRDISISNLKVSLTNADEVLFPNTFYHGADLPQSGEYYTGRVKVEWGDGFEEIVDLGLYTLERRCAWFYCWNPCKRHRFEHEYAEPGEYQLKVRLELEDPASCNWRGFLTGHCYDPEPASYRWPLYRSKRIRAHRDITPISNLLLLD